MKGIYPTFIAQEGNDYLVFVPDLELYTEGKDMQDAIEMARDIIALHIVSLEDDNIEIPAASDYNTAYAKAKEDTEIFDYTTGLLTMVDVDTTEYRRKIDTKVVRKNVSLPSWLNYEADKAGINVSRVLQEALMNVLGVKRNP